MGTATMLLAGILAWAPRPAEAQPAGVSGRDCQTVRTCNFTRTGAVRGCLSSYTCRVCRPVRERCTVGDARICERIVCRWGG